MKEKEEQLLSLKVQKAHYEDYIESNPEWEFAGVFYDEGISGTKKENIDTGAMESELMLTILTSLAEQESVSISKNAKWPIKKQFEQGTFIIKTPPYGYRNEAGKMVIVPEEAALVRRMFDGVLEGRGTTEIAKELNEEGLRGKRGGVWHGTTVNKIIFNEKYMGDALFQKTFTDDYFNRHVNQGEENMYLCKNHHEAIFVIMMNKLRFARKIMLKQLLEALGRIDDKAQVFEIVNFNEHVDSIVVVSREEVIFNLKCGLKLKEKVVK